MKKFWLLIARFAYRRAAEPISKAPTGLPFMRDPDAPCHCYEPRRKHVRDFGDCESDGHYLCKECCHLKAVPTPLSSDC